jgi:hypothetical protein
MNITMLRPMDNSPNIYLAVIDGVPVRFGVPEGKHPLDVLRELFKGVSA